MLPGGRQGNVTLQGMGISFFGGCPEQGSIGDPVKMACFRLILRAKAIDDARHFHAGQSCLLCEGTAKKRDTHALEPGSLSLYCVLL